MSAVYLSRAVHDPLTVLGGSRYTSCTNDGPLLSRAVREASGKRHVPTKRSLVRSMVPGKARQILALLLISVAVGAGFVCQVHTTPLDHGHATPSPSHSHSSGHALLDFSCIGMAAILPTLVIFASFLVSVLHATPLRLQRSVFAFPPFIPPRPTTR